MAINKDLRDKVKKISIAGNIQDFATLNRELVTLVNTINEALEKLTQPGEYDTSTGSEGDSGDIKVTTNTDKSYSFAIRTLDGWKYPEIDSGNLVFKDKKKTEN